MDSLHVEKYHETFNKNDCLTCTKTSTRKNLCFHAQTEVFLALLQMPLDPLHFGVQFKRGGGGGGEGEDFGPSKS